MSNINNISETIVSENSPITLLDGRELPIYLKSDRPSEVAPDTLKLDTTGRYLKIGNRKEEYSQDDAREIERQFNHHLFTENAWFLLAHAEEIFSDSRMFLATVKVQNGLAYTGRSGFRCPTIGIYLEWWLNYQEAATDAKGNLVWYISGSPLSGRNCCSSVTPEGKHVRIAQRTSFGSIWSSFVEVNTRYTEAKQLAEAYSLEEVLLKLRGEDYKYRIIELRYEIIQERLKRSYDRMIDRFNYLCNRMSLLKKRNKHMQLKYNNDIILDFARSYFEKEREYKIVNELYGKRRKELKQQFHAGALNGDYHLLLSQAGKEASVLRTELTNMGNRFIHENFKPNPNEISVRDILDYARKRLK